jgi:MATE family multidrug resistance protein
MSETKISMWATILGNIVNVILNYLFITEFGFSELGIVGAAIGTIVSRFVMVGFMHYRMKRKEKFIPF